MYPSTKVQIIQLSGCRVREIIQLRDARNVSDCSTKSEASLTPSLRSHGTNGVQCDSAEAQEKFSTYFSLCVRLTQSIQTCCSTLAGAQQVASIRRRCYCSAVRQAEIRYYRRVIGGRLFDMPERVLGTLGLGPRF